MNIRRVLDNSSYRNWDISNPIFEHFFVFGPQSFEKEGQYQTIYQYPTTNPTEANYQINIFADKPSPIVQIYPSHEQLLKSLHTPITHFTKLIILPPQDPDSYIYVLRYFVTPFNSIGSTINEIPPNATSLKFYPFAIAFQTTHPFYDFYFGLLEQFVNLEPHAIITGKEADSNYYNQIRLKILDALYEANFPIYKEYLHLEIYDFLDFRCRIPEPKEIPDYLLSWVSKPLLSFIDSTSILPLIVYIISGRSVIVLGSDTSKVTQTICYLKYIAQPIISYSQIISLLPSELESTLSAPMPFIYGLGWRCKELPSHAVVVDLDDEKIKFPMGSKENAFFDSEFDTLFGSFFASGAKIGIIIAQTRKYIKEKFIVPMKKAVKVVVKDGIKQKQFDMKKYLEVFEAKFPRLFKNNQFILEGLNDSQTFLEMHEALIAEEKEERDPDCISYGEIGYQEENLKLLFYNNI